MISTRKVSLFDREIRVRLSSAAVDILLASTSILSEGQIENGEYFGSTMVTIDLARATEQISDCCDMTTADRVADLLINDDRVLQRTRQMAIREAERLSTDSLADIQVDLRVRRTGIHLHLDMDVEASIEEAA